MSDRVYQVNELVKFRMGAHDVTAKVIEDRGNIGYRGEQIVRLTVLTGPYGVEFELSASLISGVKS